jgi:hypothetical protein
MGADFVNPGQQSIVEHEIRNNHLKTPQGKGLPVTRSRTLTSGEIADFLSKINKDELRDFLAEHWFISPHYRWNLKDDSEAMKRFRSYFESKKKVILQTGGVLH